ncbi:MAG: hypothetical protein M1831_003899 [Alyxoria varia]|nr:MAG: hypothetical protein M1831_003899 [Alyxoria varia]
MDVQERAAEEPHPVKDKPDGKQGDKQEKKDKIARKRSKTGCLTCRKRRIKCGEQRPCCDNCIKSKRHCDYNARIVFRKFPFGGAGFGANLDPSLTQAPISTPMQPQVGPNEYYAMHSASLANVPSLAPIRPRPAPSPNHNTCQVDASTPKSAQTVYPDWGPKVPGPAILDPSPPFPLAVSAVSPETYAGANVQTLPPHLGANDTNAEGFPIQYRDYLQTFSRASQPSVSRPFTTEHAPFPTGFETVSPTSPFPLSASSHGWDPQMSTPLCSISPQTQHPTETVQKQASPTPFESNNFYFTISTESESITRQPLSFERSPLGVAGCTQALDYAAVEHQDDDYYDLGSEGEDTGAMTESLVSYDHDYLSYLHNQLLPYRQEFNLFRNADHRTFLFDAPLDTYRPERVATPLKNPLTARVLAHFITSVALRLSPFERFPKRHDNSPTQRHPLQPSQDLWTRVMPMMALHDQGLLHAMLALASLQIARHQGASETPSVKHYSWSLRRVHRSLAQDNQRTRITALAATLLLGFYEVMTSDTPKWCTHVCGASQLIVENNFFQEEEQISKSKVLVEPNLAEIMAGHKQPQQSSNRNQWTGSHQHGADQASRDDPEFHAFQDLFWWYAKMDVTHALVSGDDLLLRHDRWIVPPRSAIGDKDAVYGSYDHLLLLMARIAHFAAKDRKRKIKAASVQVGQQRSGPLTQTPPVPFYGMAPSAGAAVMPAAYESRDFKATPSPICDSMELGSATAQAMEEWERILETCHVFEQSLGPDFQPLRAEECPSLDSPFGRTRIYRTFDMASIWMNYYYALIVLVRAHPHMPAAATVAAGVAAPKTAIYANEIGRIAAGVSPTTAGADTDPSFEGTFHDCCGPLFFAGVQFKDSRQREWTVKRLLDIERKNGGGPAGLCANGCESAWVHAAEMGRGPPYERISRDVRSADQRISGRYLHKSGQPPTDPSDRRFMPFDKNSQLFWAMGILGTTEDLSQLRIED